MKPCMKVRVRFLSAEKGGRLIPVYLSGQYRPHIRIIGDTEYLGIQFTNKCSNKVAPNEIIEAKVTLIYYPRVSYEKLKEGLKFEILEGPRIVGTGLIIGPISFN